MSLFGLLEHIVCIGTLEVIDADGARRVFSGTPTPKATIRLHDRALHRKLFFNPDLYIGEAYMDGALTIENGTLSDFVEILTRNIEFVQSTRLYSNLERLSRLLRGWQQYNPVGRAKRHVAHHYDLPDLLYDLFLDCDRQYIRVTSRP